MARPSSGRLNRPFDRSSFGFIASLSFLGFLVLVFLNFALGRGGHARELVQFGPAQPCSSLDRSDLSKEGALVSPGNCLDFKRPGVSKD
jgi:hypothetical protein